MWLFKRWNKPWIKYHNKNMHNKKNSRNKIKTKLKLKLIFHCELICAQLVELCSTKKGINFYYILILHVALHFHHCHQLFSHYNYGFFLFLFWSNVKFDDIFWKCQRGIYIYKYIYFTQILVNHQMEFNCVVFCFVALAIHCWVNLN